MIKAGNLKVESVCSICGAKITKLKYAIRDSHEETYPSWLWRHMRSFFTFGLKRPNPEVFLPVCPRCKNKYSSKK